MAKRELGLQESNERSSGSYENYSATDTYIIYLYFYLMYLKFGFGRASSLASGDIRRGVINRDEALKIAREYDGEYPEKYIDYYLDYYQMTREEFDAVIDKWANKDLFTKENGRWVPTFEVY